MKKLVKESLNEKIRISLKDISWDDIKPIAKPGIPWYQVYVNISDDFMSDITLFNEKDFNEWKESFINKYGDEGNIIKQNDHRYEIEGNAAFDKSRKLGSDILTKEYDDKKYFGD